MRIAALDLGTNTFHLLVAEKKDGVKFLFKKTRVVKLGREGFNNGMISDKAFLRGINALKIFSAYLEKLKPDKIVAFATSALRECKNGSTFIKQGEKILKSRIEIISGEKEAELIYFGVKNSFVLTNNPVLIMDVGGGSIEFIIATDLKILWKRSIAIGAARLLEKFSPSDPINKKELASIEKYLSNHLSPVLEKIHKYKPRIIVGSSGSFDSIALIYANRKIKKRAYLKNPAFEIPLRDYILTHKRFLSSTKKQRLKMKGLHRLRVDMIVPASISINYILKNSEIKKLFRSEYSLKEGIVFRQL